MLLLAAAPNKINVWHPYFCEASLVNRYFLQCPGGAVLVCVYLCYRDMLAAVSPGLLPGQFPHSHFLAPRLLFPPLSHV